MNSGQWLPVIGLSLLAVTTVGSILGAYALGRSSWRDVPSLASEHALEARMEGIERLMETMAFEIERIGETQRFMTRVIADKVKIPVSRTGRVVTPH